MIHSRFLTRQTTFVLLLVSALSGAAAHGQQPLSKAEIVKRGKVATALVQRHFSAVSGTAFCVHESGYFITSERVYFGLPDEAEVTLVLDPGLKSQKKLKARLVRRDKSLGLALLHAPEGKNLAKLPFGSVDSLNELAEVVTLEFPHGGSLPKENPQYPAVNVHLGSVTALNRKEGKFTGIDVSSGLEFGSFGCPVLDQNGTLVGMVTETMLEKSGNDYLLVTSRPPLTARRGAMYIYQLTAKSRKGGVKYQLGSSPEGMQLTPQGALQWQVPVDRRVSRGDVLITLRDAAGQEMFHTFTIRLIDG